MRAALSYKKKCKYSPGIAVCLFAETACASAQTCTLQSTKTKAEKKGALLVRRSALRTSAAVVLPVAACEGYRRLQLGTYGAMHSGRPCRAQSLAVIVEACGGAATKTVGLSIRDSDWLDWRSDTVSIQTPGSALEIHA